MSIVPKSFRVDESWLAFTIRRPVSILMVTLAVGVFGWVSYQRLSLTLMPDMSYPTLTVRTSYPGTAPEEVENIISRPLEQELGIIPRLASISSVSKAGQSDVILEFQWDTDMDVVSQEVREKVDRIRLPDGAERPLLLHYDPTLDPVLRVGLAGPQSLYDLRYLAEHDIKRRLESLAGVAAVKIKGGLEEQFLVALDESKLATLKLDIGMIGQRLQQGNVNMPGGNLREAQTEYLIRTLNEFRTLEEINSFIVTRQNGVDIRLGDIARVTRYHKDREVITRVNGLESVEIEIYKEADANVVTVAAIVRAALFGNPVQQKYWTDFQKQNDAKAKTEGAADAATAPPAKDAKVTTDKSKEKKPGAENRGRMDARKIIEHQRMTDFLSAQLPKGASLTVLSDQSIFIKSSIDEVKSNALSGAIIAIVILYLFLRNLTHTIIIGLTIPLSIVATFAPMFMTGVSLNIISLGGLALGVGMLVDNAIVVLESIFRCREEGDDLQTAVVRGTSEVSMAVVASTLTTVAVFFPIVFVEGVAGQVFGDMALTVVFSLLASLIAALFLIPMLASRQFGESRPGSVGAIATSQYLTFPSATAGVSRIGRASRHVRATTVKVALAVLMAAAVVIKFAAVLLFAALWPVLALVQRSFARKKPNWFSSMATWAAADKLGRIHGSTIWPHMLEFGALTDLGRDTTQTCTWLVKKPRWRMAVRAVPALLRVAFALLRFVAALIFRAAGSFMQSLALGLLIIIVSLARGPKLLLGNFTERSLGWFESGYRRMEAFYPRVIAASLKHRFTIVAGSFAAFLLCCLFVLPRLGKELIPQVHQGEFYLDITLPIGTPLEHTAEIAGRIEEWVDRQPEVERTAFVAGAEETSTSTAEAGEHTTRITVKMKPGAQAGTEQALIERTRAEFQNLAETKLEVTFPTLFSFKSPIEVEIRGHDLEALKRLSREAETAIAGLPGLVDVRSSLQSGHPEIQIVYNRDRLSEYGLNLRTVAELVRTKVQGRVATEFRKEDQLIDIVVRLREEDRVGLEELSRLIVNPGAAVPIRLSAIANLIINEGPNEIRRVDQQRTALITANVAGADLATASKDIVTVLESLHYPPGFNYKVAGQNQEMQTSLNSLILAFSLALFLVYIVMASQFESLIQPFLIMMTVPLAMIGVLLALWLGGIPLSIMVFLGLIILAGIVVNNAIVLVDYINTLRSRGMEKTAAIVEAGRARLRPILMTTLTTVLGLLPMSLGLGDGAEIRAPMAITVIIGLTTSTLLTLVVIPTLYYQFGGGPPTSIAPEVIEIPPPSSAMAELSPAAK